MEYCFIVKQPLEYRWKRAYAGGMASPTVLSSAGVTLFEPLQIRDVVLRNRIVVSPMCQYSAEDGFANEWHMVHLGSRAVGGAGAVIVEATAVEPGGRISYGDTGIWSDAHAAAFAPIVAFMKKQGAAAGIQIAHAGRKASTDLPWLGGKAIAPDQPNGWQVVAPSAIPFHEGDPAPSELSREEIEALVASFGAAAARALEAGFEILEIHAAHGYLLNEFLSPLTNKRTDAYGGPFENRIRMAREVTRAVRREWPERLPLWIRISATDWVEGGWDVEQSVELARVLKQEGVDLVDASSGGVAPHARIPVGPGYQTPLAERIRREAGILTGAVGMITEPQQAQAILDQGQADVVMLARELLRDPYWPLHAAKALDVEGKTPPQYAGAFAGRGVSRATLR